RGEHVAVSAFVPATDGREICVVEPGQIIPAKVAGDARVSAERFQTADRVAARADRSGVRTEHGRDGRVAGARVRYHARRAGRIRAGIAHPGSSGAGEARARDLSDLREESRDGGQWTA